MAKPLSPEQAFQKVVASLPTSFRNTLSNEEQLELYGLYKQATQGTGTTDSTASTSWTNPIRRAKDQAWTAQNHLTSTQAMKMYVKKVESLACERSGFQEIVDLCQKVQNDNDDIGMKDIVIDEDDSPTKSIEKDDFGTETAPKGIVLSSSAPKKPFLGVSPMIPRGRLDIDWSDLAFVASHCLFQRPQPKQLPPNMILGLSVRTLLDAWLQGVDTTHNAQIIVTPPINVSGMTQVLQHHGLKIVGVDLPEDDTIAVNVPAVREAMKGETETVAVLVVHVFGHITTTDSDLEELSSLTQEHGATLLVDAAESYDGEALDSSEAIASMIPDVVFYSFGFIKTSTSLRGGVALVKDDKIACDMHRRLAQYSISPNPWSVLLKAVVTQTLVTSHPWWYGLLYTVVGASRWDATSRHFLRGFRKGNSVRDIRRRLPVALEHLLLRRLQSQSSTVQERVAWATRANAITSQYWKLPNWIASNPHYYWLYPVLANSSDLCERIRGVGWDATCGSLQCVSNGTTPKAQKLMDRLVCLPIHANVEEMVQRLELSDAEGLTRSAGNRKQPTSTVTLALIATVVCFLFTKAPVEILLRLIWAICVVMVFTGATIFAVQQFIGDYYLKSSSVFAKYADVCLSTDPQLPQDCGDDDDGDPKTPSCTVLMTGSTGFVGSMLLRDLLWNRKRIGLQKVVILCRAKREKSPQDRMNLLLGEPIFQFLSEDQRAELIEVLDGDVTERFGGLSSADRSRTDVTHIIHCASAVSFKQRLADSASQIITPSIRMQELARFMSSEREPRRKVQFVHMSTAFVHGQQTTSCSLPETLYNFGPHDPNKIYDSMLTTQYYASKAMVEHGFPNTYTFSKSVVEHILLQNDPETIIIRPSIVGPALQEPYAGWAGRVPSTLTAGGCLYMQMPFTLWIWGPHKVPCVPVDILSRFILQKVFSDQNFPQEEAVAVEGSCSLSDEYEKLSDTSLEETTASTNSESDAKKRIFNAAFNVLSKESTSFTWEQFACAIIQVGSVMGYPNRFVGNVAFLLFSRIFPRLQLSLSSFDNLQNLLVRAPLRLAISVLKRMGFDFKHYDRAIEFMDLPSLFYPFTTADFTFESELTAPRSLNGEKYVLICAFAIHRLAVAMRDRRSLNHERVKKDRSIGCFTVAGSRCEEKKGIFWALSQPEGTLLRRLIGWLLSQLLDVCFESVTLDISSFTAAANCLEADWMVLAPTHRSFFDFLLLGFIGFAIPEMQIKSPHIAAAEEFQQMPLIGWFARQLGAFYVSRGRQTFDSKLSHLVQGLKGDCSQKTQTVEVFVEGTRSRDGRFCSPRTGLLRCLHSQGESSIIVPIAISYERVAEQEALVGEVIKSGTTSLSWSALLLWLERVVRRKVNLGSVHIAAGKPIYVDNSISADWADVVQDVQRHQAAKLVAYDSHISATGQLLGLPPTTIRSVFDTLGIPLAIEEPTRQDHDVSHMPDSLLSLALQFSFGYAKLFKKRRPRWAKWFWSHSSNEPDCLISTDEVSLFVDSFIRLLDEADRCSEMAFSSLRENGFLERDFKHITQVALRLGYSGPVSLLYGSVSIKLSADSKPREVDTNLIHGIAPNEKRVLWGGEELGFWGHQDTKFILAVDGNHRPVITLESKRYGKQKKISGLLSFMTKEMDIGIDLSHEAFMDDGKARSYIPSRLSADDIVLLEGVVNKVSVDEDERIRHGTGQCHDDIFSIRSGIEIRIPDGIIWPSSEAEVETVINLAKTKEWCMIPYGGGTNVTSSTRCPSLQSEPRPILSVDMRLMDRILWLDEEDRVACIEAGVTGATLTRELSRMGFTMGHVPDSIEFSTLGGWIATKASGMKRNKYGNIEDIVLGVTAVGTMGKLHHGKSTRTAWGRESCNLDVRNLFLGSEGCLGIVTSAVVRIWPMPDYQEYDGAVLRDFGTGLRLVRDLSRNVDSIPASVRLLDNPHFRLGRALDSNAESGMQQIASLVLKAALAWKQITPEHVVCISVLFEGSKYAVAKQRREFRRLVAHHSGFHLGPGPGRAAYQTTFMIGYLRDFALTYYVMGESFESFVPWSRVETVVKGVRLRIQTEHANRMLPGRPFVGARVTQLYATGACVYFYFSMSYKGVPEANKVYSGIEQAARAEILNLGGSLSHHHGIGKIRASFLRSIDSSAVLSSMQQIKNALDPENVFGAQNGYFSNSENLLSPGVDDTW